MSSVEERLYSPSTTGRPGPSTTFPSYGTGSETTRRGKDREGGRDGRRSRGTDSKDSKVPGRTGRVHRLVVYRKGNSRSLSVFRVTEKEGTHIKSTQISNESSPGK